MLIRLAALCALMLVGALVSLSPTQARGDDSTTGVAGQSVQAKPAWPSEWLDAEWYIGVDDGTFEWMHGWGNSAENKTYPAIWLNRLDSDHYSYPIRIHTIWIAFPDQYVGSLVGREIELLVYHDPGRDNWPGGASRKLIQRETIREINTWLPYAVDVTIDSPGDIYVGWWDKWAEDTVAPRMYPAYLDDTTSRRRSWLSANRTGAPSTSNLASNDHLNLMDLDGYPGNFAIRIMLTDQTPATPTPTVYVPPTPTETPQDTPTATLTPSATPIPPTPTIGPGCLFSDVCPPDYWFEPVSYLWKRGVISGYNDNTFRPHNNTTRGQLTKIIVLAESLPIDTSDGPHFSDVPNTDPFYQFVETAVNRQIISGYADGSFRPYANVTRGQLSKVVVVAEGWALSNPLTPTFRDVARGSAFYQYVETAAGHGIISGYDVPGGREFRWSADATRGQISKIVHAAVTSP